MKQLELERIVEVALERYYCLRTDDFKLWLYVSNIVRRRNGQSYGKEFYNTPIVQVIEFAKQTGLPAFASVSRCRRKIQVRRPDLCDEETCKARQIKEQEYKEYSRRNNG